LRLSKQFARSDEKNCTGAIGASQEVALGNDVSHKMRWKWHAFSDRL